MSDAGNESKTQHKDNRRDEGHAFYDSVLVDILSIELVNWLSHKMSYSVFKDVL